MIKANFNKNINLPSSLNMQSANLISTKVRSVAITLPRTWQVFGERLLVERFNTVLPRFSVDSKLKKKFLISNPEIKNVLCINN